MLGNLGNEDESEKGTDAYENDGDGEKDCIEVHN